MKSSSRTTTKTRRGAKKEVITREDYEAGKVDLSELIAPGPPLPPLHPGQMLREEFLRPMKITAYRLAKDIRVPVNRVTAILSGQRAITADTAMRLGRYFGMSTGFWMNLQLRYDLEKAEMELAQQIEAEVQPRAKAA